MNAPDIKEQLVTRAFAIQHSAAPETIRLLREAAIQIADLRRQLAEAREVKPEQVEMLAKEMQAIVAADRWKGRSLDAAPPEKWHRLRPETQQFWIDTAARILSALKGTP